MISFACTCGEKFDVPETMAGDEFQCPRCMRLVDVPQLSELGMIAEDGTFNLYDLEPNPTDLAGKMAAFGQREDVRRNIDEFLASNAVPADAAPPPNLHGPRYDPETGERVMPVELRVDPVIDTPHAIPMATPVLSYSSGPASPNEVSTAIWWQMPVRLVTGMNLFAIVFVFFAHVVVQIILSIPGANFILSPFVLFAVPLILAHYCNTMEDFGVSRRDRIPVMFRNGSVGEDLLRPLFNIGLSVALAFGPLLIFMFFAGWPPRAGAVTVMVGLFWLGVFLFPAVIFTATNSGAIQNLLPQRALMVIFIATVRYLWAAAAFGVACVAYLMAFQNFTIASVTALQFASGTIRWTNVAVNAGVVCALLAIAIYTMHLAAAWLGLIYQSHYEKLNWVLQRHEKVNRTDTNAQLADMRRRGDPRLRKPAPVVPQPVARPVQSIEPSPSPRLMP